MSAAVSSKWTNRRRRVYQSVFPTNISQPTPYSTPSIPFAEQGQPFGGPALAAAFAKLPNQQQQQHPLLRSYNDPTVSASAAHDVSTATAQNSTRPRRAAGSLQVADANASSWDPSQPAPQAKASASLPRTEAPMLMGPPQQRSAADDQVRYDRAWHVVTSRLALPASATAEDSFGTMPPESQAQSQDSVAGAEFTEALRLVVDARLLLPRAAHTEDVVDWHTQQVRRHFSQHVLPLLSACADGQEDDVDENAEDLIVQKDVVGDRRSGPRGNYYEKHMVVVMSSVRTLEAALRLYSYGLTMILRGLHKMGRTSNSPDPDMLGERFRRDVHALVSNSASPGLMRSLRFVLVRLAGLILGVSSNDARAGPGASPEPARATVSIQNDLNSLAARKRLLELIGPLYDVGLAGERFQTLFAEVMDSMMMDYIRGTYSHVWTTGGAELTASPPPASFSAPSPCISSLCDWVENHYARLAIEVLSRITPPPAPQASSQGRRPLPPVTLADVKTYQSVALGRLAALRISELFDIVLAWPASRGALADLRAAITTPQRRLRLTESFAAALRTRLLHPGRSTLEILQTYIAMIRTFHALDHSKVLLSRVVPGLQLYLCGREDAVRVVVTGLLASPEEIRAARIARGHRNEREGSNRHRLSKAGRDGDDGAMHVEEAEPFMTPAVPGRPGKSTQSTPDVDELDDIGVHDLSNEPIVKSASPPPPPGEDKLVELALLLNDPAQTRSSHSGTGDDDAELDWEDMTWVPDPVDAGANYRRPRSEDVIGTLISALGAPDAFIREFQAVVAERLLSAAWLRAGGFAQEARVLELLRRRFGEPALQNCDVMVRDVADSRRLDGAILRKTTGQQDGGPGPELHARILSRLFWPALDREYFVLPPAIVERQRSYAAGYEALKTARKLTWLDQLGQAAVELELADRTLNIECRTYEAAVIHAFGSDDDAGDGVPRRRTAQDVIDELQMDDDLVNAALTFWVGERVLRRSGDAYVVVETLSGAGGRTSLPGALRSSSPAPATADSPRRAAVDERELGRRAMYWQYVTGMLTNMSASMPLAQMAMILKMLVPDGFPWSNEELAEFLSEKVAAGELEIVGGKYKLVKK